MLVTTLFCGEFSLSRAVFGLTYVHFIFLLLPGLLLLWRIWTFTLKPARYPSEPKELPYWVPILGHAIQFFQDSHGTLTRGREHFQDTREPFAITLAGTKLYIITSPQDAATVYKNTSSLTFDAYIRETMLNFGGSPSAVDKMWRVPGVDSPHSVNPNPTHKVLAHLCEDFYRQQLHPGSLLEGLQKGFLGRIDASLTWQSMHQSIIFTASRDEKCVSLLGWCRHALLEGATRSFFGDGLLEIQPNLLETFLDFDDNSWQLTYQLPHFLSKKMRSAKQVGIDALTRYFALPKEERQGESWLVRNLEAEMRNVGILEKDIAAFVMMIYWVINGNAYKLCFWILAHILHSPTLLSTLRGEISPAFVPNRPLSLHHLLNHSPKLEAVYNEVLRLTASSSSVRTVTAPTAIGSKFLSPGNTVLVPCRQLHFDTAVFGPDAASFSPERFLKRKELGRSLSFKPFGGGTTYCPGRFLAQREVYVFVALFLMRFDVVIFGEGVGKANSEGEGECGSVFPKIEELKPCLGIMGPAEGQDVKIVVRRRAVQ